MLKIECAGAVVQIRVRGSAAFPEDGGIEVRHRFGLRMPQAVGRMLDFWSVAGLPAPRMGRGGGGEDRAVRITRHTRNTFIASSPKWLMTLTAMRPEAGLGKAREMSLLRVAQASRSISAFSVVLSAL